LTRAYAYVPRARLHSGIRRRLAPMLGNDLRQLELVHSVLFTILGSPVLYYGDEIGMGDNIALHDRYRLRTPMQWSSDQNARFSQADPEQLYLPVIRDSLYSYEVVNVAAQLRRETSLLRRVQVLIHTRRYHTVFGHGSLEILYPANPHSLACLRQDTTETVLIVHNLSGALQPVDLDLARFHEHTPVEIFGNTAFPKIDKRPYFLSLGPYGFHWVRLTRGGYE
jgi:maltose alpha-D-glucosyltransferase/alpha-amylase